MSTSLDRDASAPPPRFITSPPAPRGPRRQAEFTHTELPELANLREFGRGIWSALRRQSPIGLVFAVLLALGLWQLRAALPSDAYLTLIVFAVAVWMWIFTKLDDTFVALGAAITLVLFDVITVDKMFSSLGDSQTWLLIGAFIISAAVTASGLATRAVVHLSAGTTTPRVLVHTLTLAVVVTAYAIPATSGRAALLIPVFVGLAAALAKTPHTWLTPVLSLVLPVTILLSAVAALIGAGAHLITVQVLEENGYAGFSFSSWLLLGLPFGLVSSHVAAELIIWLFTSRKQRAAVVKLTATDIDARAEEPLSHTENRVLVLLAITVVTWSTESLHGIHPALVALIAALVATTRLGANMEIGKAIKKVPWSMLLFMAATLALSAALSSSGAADFIAEGTLGNLTDGDSAGAGNSAGYYFIVGVVVISTLAHLVIQSRSGRSAALIPLIIALSPTVGVNPVAAAFISTAAAGFCHTLTSSAKPLALFSRVEEEHVETFTGAQLRTFALWFAPIFVALTLLFAFLVWPLLGLDLFL